jgi:hypothetical protein
VAHGDPGLDPARADRRRGLDRLPLARRLRPRPRRNAIVPRDHDLDLLVFDWPTPPAWLYAANQGTHTIVGIVAVPVLLAKLWSVIPRLFSPVRAVNFVRVPVVMSATMLLVFFPLVLAKGERSYVADTGVAPPDFLRRWLLVTAVLFAVSALAYAIRVQRHGRRAVDAPASGERPGVEHPSTRALAVRPTRR